MTTSTNADGGGTQSASSSSLSGKNTQTNGEADQGNDKSCGISAWLPSDAVIISLLAFVGGFVDAVGYLELLGVFTSSITGNLVVAAASMTSTHGVVCRFLVTLSFTVCAAINSGISLSLKLLKYNEFKIGALLYFLEAAVLLIAMLVGIKLAEPIEHAEDLDNWSVIVVACLVAASMGLHNGAVKETISGGPSTTVMTMTLVTIAHTSSLSLGYYFAQLNMYALLAMDEDREEEEDADRENIEKRRAEAKKLRDKFDDSLDKLLASVRGLVSFVGGAVVGAVISYHGAKFLSLLIPIALVIGLSINFVIRANIKSVKEKPAPAASPKQPNAKPPSTHSPKERAEGSTIPLVHKPGESAPELQLVNLTNSADPDNAPFF